MRNFLIAAILSLMSPNALALDAACTTTTNLGMARCPEDSTDWYESYTDQIDELDALAKTAKSSFTVVGALKTSSMTVAGHDPLGVWYTWTPTFTGFSVDPGGAIARYQRFGKIVTFIMTGSSAGTSNAATFTFTLPFNAAVSSQMICLFGAFDNGAFKAGPGRMDLSAGSTTATLYSAPDATGWTSSGGKTAYIGSCTYEAQ